MIITNHALVWADSEHRVLPAPENTLMVLDEAHHTKDTFRDSIARALVLERLGTLAEANFHLEDIHSFAVNLLKQTQWLDKHQNHAQGLANAVVELKQWMDSCIKTQQADRDGVRQLRFVRGQLPEEFTKIINRVRAPLSKLVAALNGLSEKLVDHECSSTNDEAQKAAAQLKLNSVLFPLTNVIEVLGLFSDQLFSGAPIAKWVQENGGTITLHACPVAVNQPLHDQFWTQYIGTVLTSVTLRTCGHFERLRQDLGIDQLKAFFRCVASPFDYQSQSRLIVPPSLPEPRPHSDDTHTLAIAQDFLSRLEGHQAALLLFCSKRQLNLLMERYAASYGDALLNQYDMPREELLATHEARLKANKRSVLVGTASLAEGLSLEKELLTLVGIAKLPFPMLSDPLSEAEAELVAENRQFFECMLPRCSLALSQMAGRLVRSLAWWEDLVVYDPRLVTKRYGGDLLSNLPPMPLSHVTARESKGR